MPTAAASQPQTGAAAIAGLGPVQGASQGPVNREASATEEGRVAALSAELRQKEEDAQYLLGSLDKGWKDCVASSKALRATRLRKLAEHGLQLKDAYHEDPTLPVLWNVAEDPALSGKLAIQLQQGCTNVGSQAPQVAV